MKVRWTEIRLKEKKKHNEKLQIDQNIKMNKQHTFNINYMSCACNRISHTDFGVQCCYSVVAFSTTEPQGTPQWCMNV